MEYIFSSRMNYIQGLSTALSHSNYTTFAIDIYGVLHDGNKPYPYSKDCLQQLTNAGHQVYLLSNSTRLGDALARDLDKKYGIAPQLYKEIVSSGELTLLFLSKCVDAFNKETTTCNSNTLEHPYSATVMDGNLEKGLMTPDEFVQQYWKNKGRFFLVGDDDYHGPLYQPFASTLTRVEDWKQDGIDFVLLGKVNQLPHETLPLDPLDGDSVKQHYQAFMQHCLERHIVFVCANPDVWAPNGNDTLLACPGFLGQLYQDMGGKVLYFGKPFPTIYRYLLSTKAQGDPARVLCVGDNVATDVMGARQQGLDVAMVLGGVHSNQIDMTKPDTVAVSQVKTLCEQHKAQEPTYIVPLLRF